MPKDAEEKQAGEQDPGILVDTAKAIGATIGRLAAKTGLSAPAATAGTTGPVKPGKLQKKQRRRVPRLQKKAMKKTRDLRGEADLERLVS